MRRKRNMEFEATTNLNEVIEDWDRLRRELQQTIRDAVNEGTRRGTARAQGLAEDRLYNPDNYNASFVREPAITQGDEVVGRIINVHQWSQAIEGGVPPHEGGAYGFRVSPGRPYYPWYIPADKRGWRSFRFHSGARAFNIFRDTAEYLRAEMPRILREFVDRATR
jgi:hypothetical protein